jgi:hypothetical protein
MLFRSRYQHRARSSTPRPRGAIDPAFAALLRAGASWVCRIESALAALGLSSAELGVLRCLADAGEPLASAELAGLPSAQSSSGPPEVAIQSLLAKALIEPVATGENIALVRITPLGLSRQAMAAEALDDVSATFAAMIPDTDRATLDRIVSRVLRASDELAEAAG